MRILLSFFLLLIFSTCQTENDYIVNNDRAGLLKLGQQEDELREILSPFKIESYFNGVDAKKKYLIVKDDKTELMHLFLYYNELSAIKIYDKRYKMKQGVKIGNTAQDIINIGLIFPQTHFGDREGLRCEVTQKDIFGKEEYLTNLQLYFSRRIYQNGPMRSIGKNAQLEAFLIGNDFDIKYEIKTKDERKKIKQEQQGKIDGDFYVNNFYNFKIKIPENWEYNNSYSITGDVVNLFYLKCKQSNSVLALSIQERSNASSGAKNLDKLGIIEDIRLFEKKENHTMYRMIELSEKRNEHRVYYSTVVGGNALLLIGKRNTEVDLLEIEEIVKGVHFE